MMSTRMTLGLAAAALVLSGCVRYKQPRIEDVRPVHGNLETRPDSQRIYAEQASRRADAERSAASQDAAAIHAAAMGSCAGEVCAALTRGEVWLGMTQTQVFAATRTLPAAWDVRGTDAWGTMIGRDNSVRDRVSELAMVSLRDGRVVSYTYREAQGLRTVATREDATAAGRRRATAQALLEQGDQLVAAGRADQALMRYDQADVIDPNDPGTTLRIAKLLDQQLRPLEALMRYQKFLHEMEIEKIEARGRANADLFAAVVAAQARVVHLQQTTTNRR